MTIKLTSDEIRIDTINSSDSAWFPRMNGVRITHLASGYFAECTEHYSQQRNKDTAYRLLLDKLKDWDGVSKDMAQILANLIKQRDTIRAQLAESVTRAGEVMRERCLMVSTCRQEIRALPPVKLEDSDVRVPAWGEEMIAIKHRFSGVVLCEFDVDTVKQATEQGKANLARANLARANLYEANLAGADLYEANLYEANLAGADLAGADLARANLARANLYEANLAGANLYGVNLYGADLYGVNLRGANLYGANLYGANLYGADLYGVNLRGANLDGANLDGEKISKTPLVIVNLRYWCLISDGFMRLGCKRYTHQEWAAFNDKQIEEMNKNALEFWKQWKEPLLAMCKVHAEEVKK